MDYDYTAYTWISMSDVWKRLLNLNTHSLTHTACIWIYKFQDIKSKFYFYSDSIFLWWKENMKLEIHNAVILYFANCIMTWKFYLEHRGMSQLIDFQTPYFSFPRSMVHWVDLMINHVL